MIFETFNELLKLLPKCFPANRVHIFDPITQQFVEVTVAANA